MLVARFDFSLGDTQFHQETLENLRTAIKNTKKLCAVSLTFLCSILFVVYVHINRLWSILANNAISPLK